MAGGVAAGRGGGRWMAACLAGLIVVGTAGTAAGQGAPVSTDEKAALLLYQSGKASFKAGDLTAALADFEKAHQLFSNRYILFYLGMTLERMNRCAEAEKHLRSLEGQLQADQEELRKASLTTCLLRNAEAAAESGKCDAANRIRAEITWTLDETLAARRAGLAGLCETMTARRRADAGDCKGALALLKDAPEATDPKVLDARETLTADCRERLAGFTPRTGREKAAWLLQEEGIGLLDAGKPTEAAARFDKALGVFAEPHIRMYAARARLASLDCPAALAQADLAVKDLPSAAGEARRMRDACDTFFLAPGVADAKTRAEVMAITLKAAMAPDPDLEAIRGTLKRVDDPRARLYLGRHYLQSGRWEPALAVAEPLDAHPPAGREAEAKALVEEARFTAWDRNEDPDKRALYRRFGEARRAVAAGKPSEAEPLLHSLDRNPFAARPLAEMLGGRGECAAAGKYVTLAVSRLALPEGWASEVTRGCALVAARAEDAKRLAAWEEESAAKRKKATILKGVGGALWVVAAAGVGVAGYYGWKWSKDKADFDQARQDYGATEDPALLREARVRGEAARDRAGTSGVIAWACGGVAAAALAGGVVAWLKGEAAQAEGTAPFPAPMAGPGAVGFSLSGRFR